MAEVFNNMARSRLASSILSTDLSLTVLTGDGNDLFPTLGVGDYFRCVLLNLTTGNTEIIKVTARSGDVFTIERATESVGNAAATAYAFNANDIIELRPTKAFYDSLTVTDAEIQAGDFLYAEDSSGTPNDIAIAGNPTVTVLAEGMGFRVKVANANSGATTLTVDATAATAIRKHHDQALVSGDLEAGGIYDFVYDGTYFQMLTPTSSTVTPSSFINTLLDDTSAGAAANTLLLNKKGADIASAATLTIGSDGDYFDVTGTTTITAFSGGYVGQKIKLHFDGSLNLTHHSTNLILPGGANITTRAGDEAEFVQYSSGDWRCTGMTRASGGFPNVLMESMRRDTSLSLAALTWDTFYCDESTHSTVNILSNSGSETIITIPNGCHWIMGWAYAGFDNSDSGERTGVRGLRFVTSGGSLTSPRAQILLPPTGNSVDPNYMLPIPLIPVTPGDVYKVQYYSTYAVNVTYQELTVMCF